MTLPTKKNMDSFLLADFEFFQLCEKAEQHNAKIEAILNKIEKLFKKKHEKIQ